MKLSTPIVERVVMLECNWQREIRVDFSNDRHHSVIIDFPYGPDQLEEALIQLARNIRLDPFLHDPAEGV